MSITFAIGFISKSFPCIDIHFFRFLNAVITAFLQMRGRNSTRVCALQCQYNTCCLEKHLVEDICARYLLNEFMRASPIRLSIILLLFVVVLLREGCNMFSSLLDNTSLICTTGLPNSQLQSELFFQLAISHSASVVSAHTCGRKRCAQR